MINGDGAFSFDPTDAAYEYLAVGEEQVITVNYRVTDPGLNGDAGLFAEKTFTITVKGTNDDPVVDLGAIATLANATEDTAYVVSVDQLLQGFSDVDATDDAGCSGPDGVQGRCQWQCTWMKCWHHYSVWRPSGVLTGYQFAPVTDYNGNVVLKYTVD